MKGNWSSLLFTLVSYRRMSRFQAAKGSPLINHARSASNLQRLTEELQQVLNLVDRLQEREASALRLRFGMGGDAPLTSI
jgi:DNA-directed RNA polymerase sigma subunit (sigma70/sigma32)